MRNPVAYFKQVAQEKREYREAMDRVKALPEDYRYVYDKIQHYMWSHVAGDGMDMTVVLADLVDLFEQGAVRVRGACRRGAGRGDPAARGGKSAHRQGVHPVPAGVGSARQRENLCGHEAGCAEQRHQEEARTGRR